MSHRDSRPSLSSNRNSEPKGLMEMSKELVGFSSNFVKLHGGDTNKIKTVNLFHRNQKKGFIDVWYLNDDGGLTLLLPHVLSESRRWSRCKMRVFYLASQTDANKERTDMATMLAKFRIEIAELNIVSDHEQPPNEKSVRDFENLIRDMKNQDMARAWHGITKADLNLNEEKTKYYLRLRELLVEHSKKSANLIVLSLPELPTGNVSAYIYMAWLHFMIHALPPVLLLRGNQQRVLTNLS